MPRQVAKTPKVTELKAWDGDQIVVERRWTLALERTLGMSNLAF